MSIPELCEQIQNTWLSQTISQSTWGYPIVGALHVLAFALSGGAVLVNDARWLKRAGLTLVITTGALLFAAGAVQHYLSTAFRMKVALLVLLLLNGVVRSRRQTPARLHAAISLALWAAVIFASRAIAFF